MVGVVLMALDVTYSPLSPLRWRYNVVVVHDAGCDAAWLDQQLEALRAARAENADQDLVVWVCRNGSCGMDAAAGAEGPRMRLDGFGLGNALGLDAPGLALVNKAGKLVLRSDRAVEVSDLHRRLVAA